MLKNKLLILFLFLFLQGCTLVGANLEKALVGKSQHNDVKRKTLTQLGFEADIDLIKYTVLGSPLPNEPNKKSTGCKKLKGSEQTECFKVSSILSKSIQKHTEK